MFRKRKRAKCKLNQRSKFKEAKTMSVEVLESREAVRIYGADAIAAGLREGSVRSWGVDPFGRLMLAIFEHPNPPAQHRQSVFSTFRRKIFGVPNQL
jgi:hypothetical protein